MEEQYLEEFTKQSQEQLLNLRPENIEIFTNESEKENYTIIIRPPEIVLKRIIEFTEELKSFDLKQFFYKPENLHLTILGGIDASISESELIGKTKGIINKYNLRFKLRGLGSNEYCSSVNAYPVNFSIYNLRKELRSSISQNGTDYSSHLSGYKYMGWINYLRYLHIPSMEFLKILHNNMERDFGELIPQCVELYKLPSKIVDLNTDRVIYRFL